MSENGNAFEESLVDAVNKLRKAVVLIGTTVLVIVAVAIAVGWGTVQRLDQQQRALAAQAVSSCQVSNIGRAIDNASHLADYNEGEAIKVDLVKGEALDPASAKPEVNALIARITSSLDTKTWAALSDCRSVAGRGEIEVFDISQGAPPAYATSLLNAQKPDPEGSIQ